MTRKFTFVSVLVSLVGVACTIGGSAAAKSLDNPTITSVSPGKGFPGTYVTIHGTNLTGATASFKLKKPGAQPVTVTPENTTVNANGTQMRVVVPDGSDAAGGLLVTAGKNGLWVANSTGQTVWKMGFMVEDLHGMKPTITGFGPKRAAPGATVTIFGSHFSGARLVALAGMKVTFRVPSDSRILARIPMKAHSGQWVVKTGVGRSVSAGHFVVSAPAT